MRSLSVLLLALLVSAAGAAPARAQTLGTFRWQLQPYGAVVNLTVTARPGGLFDLVGYEEVCTGTLRRWPVTGVAVQQPDGRIMFGFTTINDAGRGLHTRAVIQLPDLNGFYADNAGNGLVGGPPAVFAFNPGVVCPLGPRTYPNVPDAPPAPDQP
ncbi:MAG: hypothetical protein AB7H93_13870 [Vicinamibacterales bacterium]